MVEHPEEFEPEAAHSSRGRRDETPKRDDSRPQSASGSEERLNDTNENSQENISNTLLTATAGQPQRPASDSSNQSTDAEQNFSCRPSWQSSRPISNAAQQLQNHADMDGYHSPSHLNQAKPSKRRHGHEPSSGHDSDGGCSMEDATMNEAVGKISKKQRLHWSAELHTRFMSAVHHLGIDSAVPKNILQLMNVEGMTRDNVASHLQKYRLHLKRLAGVGPNDPIPPHLIPQVQAEAMRLHKAKQQQEAFQMRMLQEHRDRQDRPGKPSAPLPITSSYPPQSPSLSSPVSPPSNPQPTRLFPPLVIDHETAAGQPPFHPFAQPGFSGLHSSSRAPEPSNNSKKVGQALAERTGSGNVSSLVTQGSTSMDAVQLGYTLGLMQGASQPWKAQQQLSTHMVNPSHPALMHFPPHIQAQLFDPTAAAAAAMANTIQQQQQQPQQPPPQPQPPTSGALSLASLAALQQMYCMQPQYGAAFMVQPSATSMLPPAGEAAMYGIQPSAMWPVRSMFPPGGPYHPPC